MSLDSMLRDAVSLGDTAKVASLLKRGASVDASDFEEVNPEEDTPLLIAARNGDELTVKLLIAHGAKLTSENINGISPLKVASKALQDLMMEEATRYALSMLKDTSSASIQRLIVELHNLLPFFHFLCSQDIDARLHPEAYCRLVNAMSEFRKNIDLGTLLKNVRTCEIQDYPLYTFGPVLAALKNIPLESVRTPRVLKLAQIASSFINFESKKRAQAKDINIVTPETAIGVMDIRDAAQAGYFSAVKKQIEQLLKDENKRRALSNLQLALKWATLKKNTNIVELIANIEGVDVSDPDVQSGQTLLHKAALNYDIPTMQTLMAAGAQYMPDITGKLPLDYCSEIFAQEVETTMGAIRKDDLLPGM